MKIVFLKAYYSPEIFASSYITNDLISALIEAGHEVVVYTPTPTRGIDEEIREKYKKSSQEINNNGNLIVNRFSLPQEGKNPIQRAFRYLLSIIKQYKNAVNENEFDILFMDSTPPINGLIFKKIKKKIGCRIIYNLQDIFPDSLVNTGMAKYKSFLWKIGRKVEDKTYSDADQIVVISDDFKKNIMKKGVPSEKITVIPNWVDVDDVVYMDRIINPLFDRYHIDRSKFIVCYSGNIGMTQNFDLLLEVAKILVNTREDISFVVVGDGSYSSQLDKRIHDEMISNVIRIPFQPDEDIPFVFSLGDVGLIISKPGIGTNSVPSKTWSIMAASRPILASFDLDSDLAKLIISQECGLAVEANNQNQLTDAILYLYKNRSSISIMGNNGRKYVKDNLSKEIGTSKWLELINKTPILGN